MNSNKTLDKLPSMLIKPILSALSPEAGRARLSILIFHRVLPQPDPLFPGEVDARQFDDMLGWVKNWFNVLPLDEAVQRLANDSLPARAAAITFDDGYADNHLHAMPILQRHGMSATFFIATSFLDGGCMWNDTIIEAVRKTRLDRIDLQDLGISPPPGGTHWVPGSPPERAALIGAILGKVKYADPAQRRGIADVIAARLGVSFPDDLMMTSRQVQELRRGGMQIGAHTHTHPILAKLGRDAARQEIMTSKHHLEALLDEPVTLFAYPNGRPSQDYVSETVDLLRELGFRAAVTTAKGAAHRSIDPLQLPRFTPWDRSRARFGLRFAANLAGKDPAQL
ncbi:MAG: polysaccharide deacetylase family protein [Telluria sp.]